MPIAGPLTSSQIAQFDEVGFLVVTDVFSAHELDAMRQAFERLVVRAAEVEEPAMVAGSQFVVSGKRIDRIVWCGACEPVLSRFGQDPRLVAMASQLLKSEAMDQLINQAHFKFPGDGVAFHWHQDSRHRRYGTELWSDVNGRGSFIETATALDAMTLQNGPLQFIPCSHKRGHIAPDPKTGELPSDAYDLAEAVTVTLEPGSVVLFGPYVIHASPPNCGSSMRRLFLNGFAYPGANKRVYPGEGAGRRVVNPAP
ncbi:MAG: phytanoyl-CoA dioxygenase family protein [Bradymonadaceae bacterium]|nr:phytanoyl-CoA dioxygenase family protein [Lujinxingiaceae bacterium]